MLGIRFLRKKWTCHITSSDGGSVVRLQLHFFLCGTYTLRKLYSTFFTLIYWNLYVFLPIFSSFMTADSRCCFCQKSTDFRENICFNERPMDVFHGSFPMIDHFTHKEECNTFKFLRKISNVYIKGVLSCLQSWAKLTK